MNKDERAQKLRREIEEKQRQLELLEEPDLAGLSKLESFTVLDKVAAFDKLYVQALKYVMECIENGYQDEDGPHYMYESLMSTMLGETVWDVLRSIG